MNEKQKILDALNGLENCFVAGGAITSVFTNAPINDFDIYPKSTDALEKAIEWAFDGGWNSHASSRALTFSYGEGAPQVQIMHFDTFETAEKIFDAFDFTCCMGALDLDSKDFVFHNDFLRHCSQRFLSFNPKTRFPYASARRVQKYQDKGYTIGQAEFMKILLTCQSRPLTSWEDLKEQIGGVYGEQLVIPDDKEYSFEAAFEALGSLQFVGGKGGYVSLEEALVCVSDREIEYFESDGQVFAKLDETFEPVGAKPKNGKLVSLADMFKDGLFYKVVKKDGEYYRSIYYTNFVYKIGEVVSSESPYIFVCSRDSIANRYKHEFNKHKAIVELRADYDDVVYGSELKLKKCHVVRECDISEFEQLEDSAA